MFLYDLEKLRDLIRLRFPLPRLQAQRPRDFGTRIDIMAPADPPQFEPERLDETAELGEPDIPHFPRRNPIP